jgi:hypothetical protein
VATAEGGTCRSLELSFSVIHFEEASGCRATVDRVVLQDEAPAGVEDMARLKKGLQALAAHWKHER